MYQRALRCHFSGMATLGGGLGPLLHFALVRHPSQSVAITHLNGGRVPRCSFHDFLAPAPTAITWRRPVRNGEVDVFDTIRLQSCAGCRIPHTPEPRTNAFRAFGHCSGSGRGMKRRLTPSSGVKPWFDAARSREVLSRRGSGPLRGRSRGLPALVRPPALRPS